MITDHSSDEVKEALNRSFAAILANQNQDGGFCEAKRPIVQETKSRKKLLLDKIGLSSLYKEPTRIEAPQNKRYSGWEVMRYQVDESDLWSTWFRPLGLALISSRYPGEFIDDVEWKFRRTPCLGWHDPLKIMSLREKFYTQR